MVSCLFIFFLSLIGSLHGKNNGTPPHCTMVTKDTDYSSKFKLTYPAGYVFPGQREAYHQMYCLNPPTVNKAAATVCDWAAPPQVHFTLGDEYLHVVRQDPSAKYEGNAVVTTYQFCGHNTFQVPKVGDTRLWPIVQALE